jgi:nitric oxide dioxygenase
MSLDVQMLRGSFQKIIPVAGDFLNAFYNNLFTDYPASREMFLNVDMTNQKGLLGNSLVYIVANLENTDKLVKYLKSMGKRHATFGTKDEHYNLVGASLLKTFDQFLGAEWTEDLKNQWVQAYTVIAETMMAGAKESQASAIMQMEVALPPHLMQAVKDKAKDIIAKALETEMASLLGVKK